MPAPTPTNVIDRVDDTDQPIGVVARGSALQAGVGFRVVHILVQNAAGELLLQQVGKSRKRSPLLWGSSVAGYVFAGESYADAAQRRGNEEIGLHLPLTKLGNIRMPDQRATKFIELFWVRAEQANIRDRRHIEALRYWHMAEINQELVKHPGTFTETFLYVYRLFRAASVELD